MAILGAVRDGELLGSLIGAAGDSVLQQILGPRYPSILPVVLSILVLLFVSRLSRSEYTEVTTQ